ncbi:MAG: right-handed parallel beta-helix repeat-containing protein [Candidatus Bipolaricaulota bacterium]|nr:right-handed parallel beta-helix repeat-containing protein [Candidatus Bipolaricaulota bacterium]
MPSQPSEVICTVGPVGRDYPTITAAVNARQDPRDPNSPYKCDRIVVGPHTYKDENTQIGARGKKLIIEPSREGGDRIVQGKVDEKNNPLGQALFIIGANDVTIEGLQIEQGRTGILIQDSANIVIRNVKASRNTAAGISVQNSKGKIELEGVQVVDNKGHGIVVSQAKDVVIKRSSLQKTHIINNEHDGIVVAATSENIKISDVEVEHNKNGLVVSSIYREDSVIVAGNPSSASLSKSMITKNREHGISVINGSSVELGESHIFQNTRCGINLDKDVKVNNSQEFQEPSNWIVANLEGNVCALDPKQTAEVKQRVKKREIRVPYHIESLQSAIKDAEPVQGTEAPYLILVGPRRDGSNEYVENLCLDRSVTLLAVVPLILRAKNPNQPTVAIASRWADGSCPLHEQERAKPVTLTLKREPFSLDAGWRIQGGSLGLQVGTLTGRQVQAPVYLEVTLENTAITGQTEASVRVIADGKDGAVGDRQWGHVVQLSVSGPSILVNNSCEDTQARSALLEAGIVLESRNGALVKANLKNIEISNNTRGEGHGIRAIYNGVFPVDHGPFLGADLDLSFSKIVNNRGWGLVVESLNRASPEIQLATLLVKGNEKGGTNLQAASNASMHISAERMHIAANRGPGVHLQGPLRVIWQELPILTENGVYKDQCQIINNQGSGIRLEGGVAATLQNLKVLYNGYKHDEKGSTNEAFGNYTMSGIYAIGPASLSLERSHINNNAWNGIGLQAWASGAANRLQPLLNQNRIEQNGKWGVALVISGCIDGVGSTSFNGPLPLPGRDNLIFGNGERLSSAETRSANQRDVCPERLTILMGK